MFGTDQSLPIPADKLVAFCADNQPLYFLNSAVIPAKTSIDMAANISGFNVMFNRNLRTFYQCPKKYS